MQEDELMPRIVLSKMGVAPEELPYLPLHFTEADQFVKAQRKFGFANRFGSEAAIHCAPMFITNTAHNGDLVIPSSLVWGATFASRASFRTTSGAFWPLTGETIDYAPSNRLEFAYKHCLTSPSMLTKDFLAKRNIESVSLSTFLNPANKWNWNDKIVLLASADSRKFRGPGIIKDSRKDNGVVSEHLLTARFLDNLITGDTVNRDLIKFNGSSAGLPIFMAIIMIFAAFLFSPVISIIIATATLCGLGAYATLNLLDGQFLIPIQAMASTAITAVGLITLYIYVRFDGIRRQLNFAERLRKSLSMINSLTELEQETQSIVKDFLDSNAKLRFSGYNQALYLASSNPEKAIALSGHNRIA